MLDFYFKFITFWHRLVSSCTFLQPQYVQSGPALAPHRTLGKTKVWGPMYYILPIYMACPYACDRKTLCMYNCCFCTSFLFNNLFYIFEVFVVPVFGSFRPGALKADFLPCLPLSMALGMICVSWLCPSLFFADNARCQFLMTKDGFLCDSVFSGFIMFFAYFSHGNWIHRWKVSCTVLQF